MLSRRHLLASGLAALATPTFAAPLGLRPGIQLYMVGGPLAADAPGTLKTLHAIGYRSVETAGTGRYSAAQFRRLLDDAGLSCAACHLDLRDGDNGAQLEMAKVLGAAFAVSGGLFGTVGANPGSADADAYRRMAALANRIGGQAKAMGLSFAVHNHNMEFRPMSGTTGFDILLTQTDPALVGIEMDIGWLRLAGGDPLRYFRDHPGRFPLLHIKDFRPLPSPRTAPGNPGGAPLGRGFIDYRPIFAGLARSKAGVRHYFVEQEPPYRDFTALEAARIGFHYLERLG